VAFVVALALAGPPLRAETTGRPWVALLAGARASAGGDFGAARVELEAVPEARRTAEVLAALGVANLAQGHAAEARALLERAAKASPTLAEAHYWVAVAALRRGDAAAAVSALDAAVALAPDRPAVRLARGIALAAAGRAQDAADDVLAAARREPNLLVPTYHPDERRGVIDLAELGLRQFPDRDAVDDAVAQLLLQGGLWHDARRRAASKETAAALEIRGRLALEGGDAAEAARLLGRAAAARPRSAGVRFDLARAALRQGEKARALATLQEAARLDPADSRVQIALGDLHLEQGDLRQAELAYGYALSRVRSAHASAGLGRALELQGDLDGALRHYRQAVALAPADVEPLERLARLLERRDPADPAPRKLRRQIDASTAFEREFSARVEEARSATSAHAEACDLIARDAEGALARLRRPAKVGGAASAFGQAAALLRLGKAPEARRQARALLAALPARRWARGARPRVELRRRIGPVTVVRVVDLELVPSP
jgi:tetratricopeptide (TPR) repeat protein